MRKLCIAIAALLVIAGGAFAQGMWKDGVYTAEQDVFERGWKNLVRVVVTNGYVVDVHFDAIPEGGGKLKYLSSIQGEYGMLQQGGAQASWAAQADAAAAELVRLQDPAQLVGSASGVDAISGVSMTILPHFRLAQQALRNARR